MAFIKSHVKLQTKQMAVTKDEVERQFARIFRYPVWILGCTGILPDPCPQTLLQTSVNTRLRRVSTGLCLSLFCALHLYNLTRVVDRVISFVRHSNPGDLLVVYVFCVSILYSFGLFVCENINLRLRLESLAKAIRDYHENFGVLHDISKRHTQVVVFIIVCVVADVVYAVLFLKGTAFYGDKSSQNFMLPFLEMQVKQAGFVACVAAYAIIGCVLLLTIQSSFLLHVMFLYFIVDEFKETAAALKRNYKSTDRSIEDHFNFVRDRHQALCRMVAHLNKVSQPAICIHFFFDILNIFVFIYYIGSVRADIKVALIMIFSNISINVVFIFFMTSQWGQLPTSANAVVEAVADVDWSKLSPELVQKMSLLLSRCTNHKIGLDVFGLFILDGSSTIKVLGTLLTYSIVVIQFQEDNKQNCQCQTNTTLP